MGLFSAVGALAGGLLGGSSGSKSARVAAESQERIADQAIAEERRQFDLTRADFASEQQLGEDAIGGFRALSGLDGPEAQAAEIAALKESPLYRSLYGAGEEAILATKSATGGLRGGNIIDALSRFGGDTLSQVIRTQLGDYAGAISVGTGSDAALGNLGAGSVARSNDARFQASDAQAQAALVRGGVNAQNFQNAGTALGEILSQIKF